MNQFGASRRKLQVGAVLSQSQRVFVLDVFAFDWLVAVPKIENSGDYYADAQAAEEEPTVSGKPDQQDKYQCRGDDQAGSATHIPSVIFRLRIPFHKNVLPLFYRKSNTGVRELFSLRPLRYLCALCGQDYYRKVRKGRKEEPVPDGTRVIRDPTLSAAILEEFQKSPEWPG